MNDERLEQLRNDGQDLIRRLRQGSIDQETAARQKDDILNRIEQLSETLQQENGTITEHNT